MHQNGPRLWGFEPFKGHLEVETSHDSGISDPHFEMLRFEVMRVNHAFGRSCGGVPRVPRGPEGAGTAEERSQITRWVETLLFFL